MTFNFIERVLRINRRSKDKVSGVVIMKIIISILENLHGNLDENLPYILHLCFNELSAIKPKGNKNF
jgi:hypothetical protein